MLPPTAPYADRFIEVNDVRLHYLDYGIAGKPPILCVHGGAASAHWYDFVAASLTRDHHLLALDLRGHGDSAWSDPPAYQYRDYAADIEAFAEALDLQRFTLIGHSMGGGVSVLYTANYPKRVTKLVVVDSTVHLTPERVATLQGVGVRPGRHFESKEALVEHFQLRPGPSHAAPEIVRIIANGSARQFPDGMWRHKFDRNIYATRIPFEGKPFWAQIRQPVLLVKGGRSDRITREVFAGVKAVCPQATLVEVPGSGHHVMLDNPEGFIEAVKPFLAQTVEPGA